MVLLAAAVCTKDGKALISRQFVEMTRTRIEGLIATFPKLISSGKQHTFLETESVRYVYRPLEKLYLLLITTKASNILEDHETLRLFARVIPEYGEGVEESDILENAFQILFAFDEIVALGYAESVNIAQIRTYIEMDSHEERVFDALRENQEREAKENMKRKAKELQQARLAAMKGGANYQPSLDTPIVSSYDKPPVANLKDDYSSRQNYDSSYETRKPKRGMKLGSKGLDGNVHTFVDKLKAEGEVVQEKVNHSNPVISKTSLPVSTHNAEISIVMEEKLTAQVRKDGGVDTLELHGIMQVQCQSESAQLAKILVDTERATTGTNYRPSVQLQTHPNMDKKVFQSSGALQPKANGKPYPVNTDVGVLKWRFSSQEEKMLPVTINCWPNQIPGGFEVNIEYELQDTESDIELCNLTLKIPLPASKGNPQVSTCDGEYVVDSRRTALEWVIPIVNSNNPSGSIEFALKTDCHNNDAFYPVNVHFTSSKSYCDIKILEVSVEDKTIKFDEMQNFYTEKYEVL